ncbi:galactoside 2-alpha-L-fucosyltransferase SEC1-like [Liolophura sinensis]|uniref:galactoside 2-alpha-L-fucosyltransferase SEC1-like n=1 Tax=Liolophura sinensis TaxID=3198878 RepID=UPI003158352C
MSVDHILPTSESPPKKALPGWKKLAVGETGGRFVILTVTVGGCIISLPRRLLRQDVITNTKAMEMQNITASHCSVPRRVIHVNLSSPDTTTACPSRLCCRFMGRLGNQMFQFASLVGISRSKGMLPVIRKSHRLHKIFTLNGITSMSYDLCRHVRVHQDKRSCAFDPQSIAFSNTKDIGLFGYFQSWKYFANSSNEIRRLLTIQSTVLHSANHTLNSFIQDQHGIVSMGKVLVGMHIRRGDIARSKKNQMHGYVLASKDYLLQAMTYYRQKYGKVLFVVCSDSKLWPFLHIPHNDTVFISGQMPELDMAILSLCDHSIITVGSFGWWSAWLANGNTVYPKHQYHPGSRLERQFNLTDYFPPEWIGM